MSSFFFCMPGNFDWLLDDHRFFFYIALEFVLIIWDLVVKFLEHLKFIKAAFIRGEFDWRLLLEALVAETFLFGPMDHGPP